MSDVGGIAAAQLRSFIDRVERLEEEKKQLGADVRVVMGEARAAGFDTKILRKVLALRKLEDSEREEQKSLIELYMAALESGGTEPPRAASSKRKRSERKEGDAAVVAAE